MLSIIDPWHAAAQASPAGGFTIFGLFLHCWPLPLLLSLANASAWWQHAQQEAAQYPSLDWQYGRLICRILIVFNVPWLIFGAAVELPILFPALPSLPIFIASLVAFAVSVFVSFRWVYIRGGAEILAYQFDAVIPRDPIWVKHLFVSTCGTAVIFLLNYWFTVVR
jgi:hypothetical protein